MVWSAVASLAGSALGYLGERANNKSNQGIAQAQTEFQREMSNTAYQRAMADMKKAGLNPILAYKTGGASSPFGAAIPMVNPWSGAAAGGRAVSSALEAAKVPGQIRKLGFEGDVLSRDALIKDIQVQGIEKVISSVRDAFDSSGEVLIERSPGGQPSVLDVPSSAASRSRLDRLLDRFRSEMDSSGGTNPVDRFLRGLNSLIF